MSRTGWMLTEWCCMILLLWLLCACQSTHLPEALASVTPTKTVPPPSATASLTPRPGPTRTIRVRASATPEPTPKPGPEASFLYLSGEQLYRLHLRDWSVEEVPLPIAGELRDISFNDDGRYLAYMDDEGVKLSEYPYDQVSQISSTRPRWGAGVSISPNGRLLAYNDDEGLRIYSLATGKSWLLHRHMVDEEDYSDSVYMYPSTWSPEDQWLLVTEMHYEGGYRGLAFIPNGTIAWFGQDTCPRSLEWLAGTNKLAYTVQYSGYDLCGSAEGIHLLDSRHGQLRDAWIYPETTNPLGAVDYGDVHWSPNGEMISFVRCGEDVHGCQVTLIRPDGGELLVVYSSEHEIWDHTWLPEREEILFPEHMGGTRMVVVNVNTMETRDYGWTESQVIESVSPDGNWVVIRPNAGRKIILLDLRTGERVEVPGEMNRFLRWE